MSSIPQLAEWWVLNPWVGIVSLIIAVLGVALAIIFYIKEKKVKSPCYTVRSNNLVRDLVSRIDPLEMRYSGQQIENLTVTKLAFWNAGRDTIDKRDVASADPLTVYVKEGYKILDAKILYTKNSTNRFSITTSDDQSDIALQFDYVDKGEGAVIQLIHTGKSDEDIEFRGTIKGAGKPTCKSVSILNRLLLLPPNSDPPSIRKRRYIFAIIMFLSPVVPFVLLSLSPDTPGKQGDFPLYVAASITLILYWIMGVYLLKRRIPVGFDVFEEEF